jgi:hypothetical protein
VRRCRSLTLLAGATSSGELALAATRAPPAADSDGLHRDPALITVAGFATHCRRQLSTEIGLGKMKPDQLVGCPTVPGSERAADEVCVITDNTTTEPVPSMGHRR